MLIAQFVPVVINRQFCLVVVFNGNLLPLLLGRIFEQNRNTMKSVEEIKQTLCPFFETHKVLKAIIFGSFARNTATKRSDLDLALVVDTDKRWIERYDEVQGIEHLLGSLHIDMLIFSPGELEQISHRRFVQNIFNEGIVIYER